MGKLTVDDNRNHNNDTHDSELNTLIDKCNVCHSNLSISTKLCKQQHHGEILTYILDLFTHFRKF